LGPAEDLLPLMDIFSRNTGEEWDEEDRGLDLDSAASAVDPFLVAVQLIIPVNKESISN